MTELRKAFQTALEKEGAPGKWNHVTDQKGMFLMLHLTGKYVEQKLKTEDAYYDKL